MADREQFIQFQTQWGPVDTGQSFILEATPAPPPWIVRDRPEPLSDWEWHWGSYNGWDFGWDTPWQIDSVDGLADMMELKTQDAPLAGDGEVFGQDWEQRRILTVEFSGSSVMLERCFAPVPGESAPDRIMDARCACMRRQDDLPLQINDQWVVMARPRKFTMPQRRNEPPKLNVSWEAQDPALYSVVQQTAIAGLALEGEGRAYPRPWGSPGTIEGSWRYRGTQSSGLMWVDNQGCRQTYLTARFTGPATNPMLVNQSTFEVIEFNVYLNLGEWLEVDMRRGLAILNGTATRYYTITPDSSWWACQPGRTPVRFLSRGATTSAQCQIWWRSAW